MLGSMTHEVLDLIRTRTLHGSHGVAEPIRSILLWKLGGTLFGMRVCVLVCFGQ